MTVISASDSLIALIRFKFPELIAIRSNRDRLHDPLISLAFCEIPARIAFARRFRARRAVFV
jgi:hypothetical protein